VAGKVKDIRPQKRFPARKDNHRFANLTDLVEQDKAGICVQFIRVWPFSGCSTAMDTGKIAVAGDLPGYKAEV
jgi:hypothetical protein